MSVAESTRLVDLVQERIDEFLEDRAPALSAIAGELDQFVDYSRDLLAGGKRFRALFCYWGWQSVNRPGAGFDLAEDSAQVDFPSVVSAAAWNTSSAAAALTTEGKSPLAESSATSKPTPGLLTDCQPQ